MCHQLTGSHDGHVTTSWHLAWHHMACLFSLEQGIVVKVISRRLGDALYKKRGYVEVSSPHCTLAHTHYTRNAFSYASPPLPSSLLTCYQDVRDHYTAHVRMLDSNTLIKVDQAHLETVLPALGM